MDVTSFRCGIVLFADMDPAQSMILAVVITILVISVLFTAIFAKLFGLWLRAHLAGAPVSIVSLFCMMLRRTPMKQIVRWRIMAAQAQLHITTDQIESAFLQGVDVERAILVLIRARQVGQEVTWNDVLSEDANQRLKSKLYDE